MAITPSSPLDPLASAPTAGRAASAPATDKAPPAPTPLPTMSDLQNTMAQNIKAEDALVKKWADVAGAPPVKGQTPTDALQAFAVSQMDPVQQAAIGSIIHLGGASPEVHGGGSMASAATLEKYVEAQLGAGESATLKSIMDPFAAIPAVSDNSGLAAQSLAAQSKYLEQIAYLGMDPLLRGALATTIQLN